MAGLTTKLSNDLMELLGTAILVFTIQVTAGLGSTGAPFAIAAIFITLVFAGGPISGAHYNPAITLAVKLRGKCSFQDLIEFWIAQVLGGFLGALLGGIMTGTFTTIGVGEGFNFTQAMLAELIFTFVLCFVVLGVTTSNKATDNHYYGLAIGLVLLSGNVAVGPISGGAFNPGVALGLSFATGLNSFGYAISVVIANLVGGILSSFFFFLVAPDQFNDYTPLA